MIFILLLRVRNDCTMISYKTLIPIILIYYGYYGYWFITASVNRFKMFKISVVVCNLKFIYVITLM